MAQLSCMEKWLIATVQLRKCMRPSALARLQEPAQHVAAFAPIPQQRVQSRTAPAFTNQLAPGAAPMASAAAANILAHTRSLSHHATPPPVVTVRLRRRPFEPTREQVILGITAMSQAQAAANKAKH